MKKRFDHAISFNMSLKSNNEEPTPEEVLKELKRALSELDESNILDAVEIFDTLEND